MRKRTKSKKKVQAIAKASTVQNQVLDKLFTNVELIRRDWYTENVHKNVLDFMIRKEKLNAIKFMLDISREKDGDYRFGLKQLKDFVDQFDVPRPVFNPLPFNADQLVSMGTFNDREMLNDVIQLISDEVKHKNSTNGLRELLSYVPLRVIKKYWLGIK